MSQLTLDSTIKQLVHVKYDIKYFINTEFNKIYQKLPNTTFKKICEECNAVEELALWASGLFIWAATVCKFIFVWPCVQRLNVLLDSSIPTSAVQALTILYCTALDAIVSELVPNDIGNVRECILCVLGTIMVAQASLEMTTDHRPS